MGSNSRSYFVIILTFIACFYSFSLLAAERIDEIHITGNKQTKTWVIRHLSGLTVGEELTDAMVKEAQANILSAGIFENVTVEKQLLQSGRYDVFIRVKEKTTWFLIPYFSYSTQNKSGGLVFGEANLFGRLKQTAIFADYGTYMRRAAIGYKDPHLFDSDAILSADGMVRYEENQEYNDDGQVIRRVKVKEKGFRLMPGYKWSRAFSTSFGVYYRFVKYDLISDSQGTRAIDLTDGHDVAASVHFEYNTMKNHHGLQYGSKVELETQLSDNRFYSDLNYYRQAMRLTRGFIFQRKFNWVGAFSVQYGSSLPYYREITAGGAMNLRGFHERQFRGDTRYSGGSEFMVRLLNQTNEAFVFFHFFDKQNES